MPGWSLVRCRTTEGSIFSRPLDVTETGFFWDAAFNGTADSLIHVQLRLLNEEDQDIFSEANLIRTWLSVKQRYPLLGATIDPSGGEPRFVVQECRLININPGEFSSDEVNSAEEAQKFAGMILHGSRPLSNNLMARAFISRQKDRSDVIHIMVPIAHCITDGIGNYSFIRCFVDTLSSRSDLPTPTLEKRLAMASPLGDLVQDGDLTPAMRRWRLAAGFAIFQVRMSKRQGGHTLPCRLTPPTFREPALSRQLTTSLSPAHTAAIVANCRRHSITFGNAYLPLAQVAMTRVLYRRYLRGEIGEEEWQYRKRQPYISGGPLNLRPYLNKEWLDKGGGGELLLAISFFFYQLPFMTMAPPFANLLTFNRFLHRANMIKRQAASLLKHPLSTEIALGSHLGRLERTRHGALEWMKSQEEGITLDKGPVLEAINFPGAIWAHGGSSMGDVDGLLPREYPLRSTNPLSPRSNIPHPAKAGYVTPLAPNDSDDEPKITMEYFKMHLHTRPGELYLGAITARKHLHLSVYYDGHVYEDAVVQEWLDEVRHAAVWYLAQSHLQERSAIPKL
ncbi:hypothetical protein F5I97DRAFT_1923912 [Phlebopus sp. FC_14]|nr:hypothetical protein F5I97DRAFT_1923912 [Phlebopus sp. FC_14]